MKCITNHQTAKFTGQCVGKGEKKRGSEAQSSSLLPEWDASRSTPGCTTSHSRGVPPGGRGISSHTSWDESYNSWKTIQSSNNLGSFVYLKEGCPFKGIFLQDQANYVLLFGKLQFTLAQSHSNYSTLLNFILTNPVESSFYF